MNVIDNNTKCRKPQGMSLASFVILWLIACAITISATIYAPEIKRCFCGLTDIFGSHSDAEERNLPNSEINIDSDKFNVPQKDELRRDEGDCDKNAPEKDLPALNSTEQENLKALNEELKKPIKAFCDFLKTDDIEYFYKAIPPDCTDYLKQEYADAILLMGGESKAIKKALGQKLSGYKTQIGELKSVSCDIYEVSELNEAKLSELEKRLREFGSQQGIERAFKLKSTLCLKGEKASIKSERIIRLIKIQTEWFINPEDLIDPALIP